MRCVDGKGFNPNFFILYILLVGVYGEYFTCIVICIVLFTLEFMHIMCLRRLFAGTVENYV